MESQTTFNFNSPDPKITWFRSRDGVIAGVCMGLANKFGMDVTLLRVLWVISVLFLGVGLGLYIMLALSLPREDRLDEAYDSKLLGVCSRISRKAHLEVGVVRFLAILLAFFSVGATIVGYVVLYFILPENEPGHPASTSVNGDPNQSL